jgi:hypothetical protein
MKFAPLDTFSRLRTVPLVTRSVKTCWTEPRGTASRQLWALHPGKEVWEGENRVAKRGDKSVVHEPWGVGQVREVREDAKLPSKIDVRLHAAMSPRSRDRARLVDVCW